MIFTKKKNETIEYKHLYAKGQNSDRNNKMFIQNLTACKKDF